MAIRGVNPQDLQRLLETQAVNGGIFNETDTYIIDGLFFKYVAGSNTMVQVEPLGVFPLNQFDPTAGQHEAQGLTPPLVNFNQYSGWAHYEDAQYTEPSPWSPTTGQWNTVPNDALGDTEEDQLPIDYPDGWYDPQTGLIGGVRRKDAFALTMEFAARPTTGSDTFMEIAFFVGGTAGPLDDGRVWQRTLSFPKGINQIRVFNSSTIVHVEAEAEANGALFQVNPNAAVEIWGIAYEIYRLHKNR